MDPSLLASDCCAFDVVLTRRMARNANSEVLDSPISNNLAVVRFHVIDRRVVNLSPLDDLVQLSKDIDSLGLLIELNAVFLPVFIVGPSGCRSYAFPEGGGVFAASCSSPGLVDDSLSAINIDPQSQEVMPLTIARIIRLAVVNASVLIVEAVHHLYASQNYVFVIDYIGYNDNSTKPHPYIIFPFKTSNRALLS